MQIQYERSVYNQALTDLCQNALLHLYINTSESTRFIPLLKRNDILRKYLKPKLVLPKNKNLKSELKRIIAITKKGNGERCLNELLQQLLISEEKQAMIDKFVFFLAALHQDLDINVNLSERSENASPNTVYLLKEQLFNYIDSKGKIIEPISLLLYTKRIDEIYKYLTDKAEFKAQLIYRNDANTEGHIILSSFDC